MRARLTAGGVVGLVTAILVLANLGWRRLARRQSLPCPTWLGWLLETPVLDWLAGTRVTLDRLDLRPGQRVLEVGPGPGRLLIPAARRVLSGGEVVGLDIQPGMIERLKARAARAGVANLTAILGDATRTHFPPGSFDLVYLCTVLGEIPDREAALRESYAVLKPDGRLSITEILPDPHFLPRATVKRLAEAAGFRPLAIQGPWWYFTASFVRG